MSTVNEKFSPKKTHLDEEEDEVEKERKERAFTSIEPSIVSLSIVSVSCRVVSVTEAAEVARTVSHVDDIAALTVVRCLHDR